MCPTFRVEHFVARVGSQGGEGSVAINAIGKSHCTGGPGTPVVPMASSLLTPALRYVNDLAYSWALPLEGVLTRGVTGSERR
jgi:hypothetical protein